MSIEPSDSIRLLHVDPDPAFLEASSDFLQSEFDQFALETATDPDEAMQKLEAGSIDCVVSDYEIPYRNGLAWFEEVSAQFPHLPFILFTGQGSEDVASEAFSMGITDYIQKERGTDQFRVLANRVQTAVEHRRAEDVQQRQLDAIETAQEGISILNGEGRFVYVNEAFADLYGYDPADIIGAHWELIYREEDAAELREEVLPTVEETGYWHGETIGLRADGSTFIEDHTLSTTDAGGLVCTVRDITAQRENEKQLDKTARLLQDVLDSVEAAIWVRDTDGRYLLMNHRDRELLGLEDRTVIGKTPAELLSDDRSLQFQKQSQRVLEAGSTVEFEEDVRTEDGVKTFLIRETPLYDADGEMYAFCAIASDISKQKEREHNLQRYQTLVESVSDAMYILDAEGNIEMVNEALADQLDVDKETLEGAHASEFLSPGDYERGTAVIGEVLSDPDREWTTYEATTETADGDQVAVEINIEPLFDDEGEFAGSVGVVRDITERKATERQLRRYETMANVAGDMVYMLDTDGRLEIVNDAAVELTGYDRDDLVGAHVSLFMEEADVEAGRELISDLLSRDESSVISDAYEWTMHTADGDTVICESHITLLWQDGEWQGTVGVVRDVTERKRAERRFRVLFENIPDPTVIVELTGDDAITRAVNAAFEDVFGYTADDAVGRSLNDLIVPPSRTGQSQEIDEKARGGEQVIREVQRQTADGELRDFIFRNVLIENVEGEPRAHGIYTDVTERTRRERRLNALHDATRDLMKADTHQDVADIASEAATRILDLPLNGVMTYHEDAKALTTVTASPRAREMFDELPIIPAGEGVAWRVYDRGTPEVYGDVRTASTVLNPDTPIRSEILLPLGDHGIFIAGSPEEDSFEEVDVSLAKLLAANVHAAFDRASRAQQLRSREQALQRQNDRLDRFAGMVSHDLRNPLSVAMGGLQLTQETGDTEHLDRVDRALDRMDRIIDDLLTLARQGEEMGETEPIGLEAATRRAWSNVETGAASLHINTDQTIVGDAGRIGQLFENLFRNATEHGGDAVRVHVGDLADRDGFFVEDTGPGIPPDQRKQVFETGFSTDSEGTGFGLAIVEEIVNAHGWSITVTAGSEGGARFEIAGVSGRDELSV